MNVLVICTTVALVFPKLPGKGGRLVPEFPPWCRGLY